MAYDQKGNLTNLVYPGGKTVAYAYDSLNRLTNVTDWAARKTSIEYDLASRVRKITRPNGTVREMNYDAAGQTTNIIERTAANIPIAFLKLNWNAAARVQWEFIAPLPYAYTPPTRTMTYDDDNRIAIFNGTGLSYDLDGNLTSGPLTNNTFATYTYDARNRLLSAGALSYAYDALDNRTSITNGANVTRFVVNPNAALSRVLLRIKNGVTNYYVYGLGLLYEADDVGNTKTYHYDSRGSTIAITDNTGTVTDRVEYSAYGTITYRTGNTDTPFLYNGRYGVQTDDNGLLYMRARYYNPYLCRFLNPDPIGFSGGLNFYAYADGNPISLIDPFGLGAVEPNDASSWLRPDVSSAYPWLRPDENRLYPCITCHGVSAGGFNGDPTSFSAYLPGSGPGARQGYEFFKNVSIDATIVVGTFLTSGALAPAAAARMEAQAIGTETQVFRVWGDQAGPWGRSWTTLDPRTIPNYRNASGLPNQNSGRFLSEGTLQNTSGIQSRTATPLHGNAGGLPEVVVPNPQSQIQLRNVQGLNPQF